MAEQGQDNFRDSIGTLKEGGGRNFIYPKKPKGKLYNYRTWLSWVLLALFFIFPFIKVNNQQFIMFNVLERQFNIFGIPFFTQDFHIFAIGIGLSVVFLILFTVIFGRIFCGWLCPQTIFLEMVFRKVEYLIEGDGHKQKRLAKQPWNKEKILKKGLKYIVFAILSLVISSVMFAYVVGSDKILGYISDGLSAHLRFFITLFAFSAVFYFVFASFREQACIIVCPYGRLQGVLLDNNSINVAYDFVRGEGENGRAKQRKKQDRDQEGYGDCVDCNMCVAVCPTGIDIRNGTQLECINCTACIDACNETMDQVGFERGLIGYKTENDIEKGEPFKFGVRHIFYVGVLTILMSILAGLLIFRGEVETVILKSPGNPYTESKGLIINTYNFTVINKSSEDLDDVTFKLLSHDGSIQNTISDLDVAVTEQAKGLLIVTIDKTKLTTFVEPIKIGVYTGEKLIEEVTVTFSGPTSLGR